MMNGKKIQIIILAVLFAAPIFTSAAVTSPQLWPLGYWGGVSNPKQPLVSCTGNYGTKFGATGGGEACGSETCSGGQICDYSSGSPTCINNPNPGGGSSAADNPCTNLEQLEQTFVNFIYFGITLVLFIFAPILFAWGGIRILTAGGSQEEVSAGKKVLTGTLWGVVITLLAYLIVYTFVRALGAQSVIQQFGS